MAQMKYIGHTANRDQIFINLDNVIAVVSPKDGKPPTKVVMVGGTEYLIEEKGWDEINREIDRG